MKFLVVVLAVLAVVFADDSSEEVDQLLGKIKHKALREYIKEHPLTSNATSQLDKHCPGATSKLINAVASAIECEENLGNSMTVCKGIRENMWQCGAPVVKAIEDCLPAENKGLPTLLMKAAISALKKACSMSGEQLFELTNDCVYNQEENIMTDELRECAENVETKVKSIGKGKIPSAKQICEVVEAAKPCTKSWVHAACGNELTRTSIMGVVDALVEPCSTLNEVA